MLNIRALGKHISAQQIGEYWNKCVCLWAVPQEMNCHVAAALTNAVHTLINGPCIFGCKTRYSLLYSGNLLN